MVNNKAVLWLTPEVWREIESELLQENVSIEDITVRKGIIHKIQIGGIMYYIGTLTPALVRSGIYG